jgi:hypothetical protein
MKKIKNFINLIDAYIFSRDKIDISTTLPHCEVGWKFKIGKRNYSIIHKSKPDGHVFTKCRILPTDCLLIK